MIDVDIRLHHYGVKAVLRDVKFRVGKGELLVIMGPNGMGKSTLLGLIAGVLHPIRGSITVDGKVRRSSEEAELAIRRKMVFLSPDSLVPFGLTVREWLVDVGTLYGIDDIRLLDHVEELLRLFDLEQHADTAIEELSTGQRAKSAVAAALVAETPILILDEPFSGGLDPSAIYALKQVLRSLSAGGERTMVMSSAVPELVEEIVGDTGRIGIIQHGRLIALGTIPELRQHAGSAARLEVLYSMLVQPEATAKVERYLGAQP